MGTRQACRARSSLSASRTTSSINPTHRFGLHARPGARRRYGARRLAFAAKPLRCETARGEGTRHRSHCELCMRVHLIFGCARCPLSARASAGARTAAGRDSSARQRGGEAARSRRQSAPASNRASGSSAPIASLAWQEGRDNMSRDWGQGRRGGARAHAGSRWCGFGPVTRERVGAVPRGGALGSAPAERNKVGCAAGRLTSIDGV